MAAGAGLWWTRSPGDPEPIVDAAESGPADRAGGPRDSADWRRRIDRYRVEDRPIDATLVGWSAYAGVPSEQRREVLRALTLALLADVPEDQARDALRRRIEADPNDLDARVALLRRSLAPEAPPADRPRIGRNPASEPKAIPELEAMLEAAPGHLGARSALVDVLIDTGRMDRARSALAAWPPAEADDPRRLRLQARLDLDLDALPDRAAEALETLLAATPHDWRLRARLARALEMRGDPNGARIQAGLVDRLRERLEPSRLGPRLAVNLARIDEPDALADLAALCSSVGLVELAAAWRLESSNATASPPTGGEPAGPARAEGDLAVPRGIPEQAP